MPNLNSLLQIMSQRRQQDEIRRQQDEIRRQQEEARQAQAAQSNFNPLSALAAALPAIVAAPFTGGLSLSEIPALLATGAVREGVRAATAQQPGAQQLALAATDTTLGQVFPSKEKQRQTQLQTTISADKGLSDLQKQIAMSYPELYAKSQFKSTQPSELLQLLFLSDPTLYDKWKKQQGVGLGSIDLGDMDLN